MLEIPFIGAIPRFCTDVHAPREKSADCDTHLTLALLVGPFLAEAIAIYLFEEVRSLRPEIMILSVAIAVFWFLPRQTGTARDVTRVRFLAITNAAFVTAYAASLFGGLHSPFFPWAVAAQFMAIVRLPRDAKQIALCWGAGALGLAVAHMLGASAPQMSPRVAENLWAFCISAALFYCLFAFLGTFALKRKLSRIDRNEAIRFEQLAQAAELTDRQSTDFFAEANYAIRTPLDAIIGYSELALEDSRDQFDEQQLGDVQRIHQACQQLLSLLGHAFDLSEIEAAQTKQPLVHDPANA